ncbi:MAG: N-acetylneuraminate synthase family protein [archaeon]|nr:N-acetylneuraminate synthase family protein [archaeon]
MPKEGYESVTISNELDKRISDYVKVSEGVNSKAQALSQAWQMYENNSLEHKKPKAVKIGNTLIGHDQPVFVIGEIGINHNGDIKICKKLIDMAVGTGCDAVKFQKRTPDLCVPEKQKGVMRETPWGTMTYLDYKKKIELGEKEYKEIDRYCKEKGIIWFASAWDIPSVNFLEKLDTLCYKIPSACLTDKKLLQKIKETGKPILLSTGMSTMDQVDAAVDFCGEANLVLFHCTSTYPTPENEHDLNVITYFRKHFNCPIGYSGHETGVHPTIMAAALGACVIERHITLDRAMYGTDQAASLEKRGLEIICKVVKKAPTYLGEHTKRVHDSEKPIRDKLRKVDDLK